MYLQEGSHEELMSLKGLYHSLVNAQLTTGETDNLQREQVMMKGKAVEHDNFFR